MQFASPKKCSPEDIPTTSGAEATRVGIHLLRTVVVFDNVTRGAFFDVHTLVAKGPDGVTTNYVVVGAVRAPSPLLIVGE